jgi:uncharacterized SAM-binding protein YcdF (DUF218 family)
MLRRAIALVVMVWVLGFLVFAVTLPTPAGPINTDAVVVLTGGEGRIDRALGVLRAHQARRLLVSGVDPEVRAVEFAAQYRVEPGLMRCCVTLGYQSVDTRSNAREAADWLAGNHAATVRLVTSDWHMRRAAWELRHAIPEQVELIEDAVPSHPSFNTLFLEYNKYIARRIYRQGKK